MRLNKKTFSFLFFFVFLLSILSFVSSAPPVKSLPVTSGLSISYPNPYFLKTGNNLSIRFWVFNVSNGVVYKNDTTNCTYNLLDNTGRNILIASTHDLIKFGNLGIGGCVDCFNLQIFGTGNLSSSGYYNYQIRCVAKGDLGGYLDGDYDVNPSGIELTEGKSRIDIGLLILLVVFFIISLFIFTKFENLLARVGMIGISYLLLMAIVFISWNMSNDFLTSAPFITEMFRILFFVLISGFFPLIIGAFIWYFLMLFKIKEIQRLMDKGFSEYDAQDRVKSEKKSRRRR